MIAQPTEYVLRVVAAQPTHPAVANSAKHLHDMRARQEAEKVLGLQYDSVS